MLRDVLTGRIAARDGLPERELYRTRDVAFVGATDALSSEAVPAADGEILRSLVEAVIQDLVVAMQGERERARSSLGGTS